MKYSALFFTFYCICSVAFSQQKSLFIQTSANGRFIQWSDGKPVFINSCTALTLTTAYSDQEVREYLDNRLVAKFNAIQISAVYAEMIKTMADSAFQNHDLLKPVPKFWEKVDRIVRQATDRKLLVLINPIWKQSLSEFIQVNGPTKCREYGKWFANRFKDNPYIIYCLGGGTVPEPVRQEIDEMGKGIQEVYQGKALIGYLSEPDQSGMEAYPNASWMTINLTSALSTATGKQYPYSENYDNWKAFPKVPILFAKGFYDGGDARKYELNGTSESWGDRFVLRRQAWWNALSGGTGNTWGAEGICQKKPGDQTWQACLMYGSNNDMGFLKQFVDKIKWWKLQPDLNHEVLTGGFGTYMTDDYAVCSVSENGSQAVLYTPVKQALELKLPDYGQQCRLRWYDPADGKYTKIDMRFQKRKKKAVIISTPGLNHSGKEDWVLIIEGSHLK